MLKGRSECDSTTTEADGPLSGVQVLDMSAIIAGPSCAKHLADHGAEVLKC
jgi:crotonobetainyl-CoA:carnitine CoA-transferase CaiB-like acyl-CoA transferase